MAFDLKPSDVARVKAARKRKVPKKPLSAEEKSRRKLERDAAKRVAWHRELAAAHAVRAEKYQEPSLADVRRHEARMAQIEKIHKAMRSDVFKDWYEATTGGDVADFLSEVVMSQEDFSRRFSGPLRLSYVEWMQIRVEKVAQANYWSDPETRAMWTKELDRIDDPKVRRRVLLRLAKPRWADCEKISEVYRRRRQIVSDTGVDHDVDHIVPIVSRVVCGLHCEQNLRVIPSSENRSKSNSFNVDEFSFDFSSWAI